MVYLHYISCLRYTILAENIQYCYNHLNIVQTFVNYNKNKNTTKNMDKGLF